MKNRLIWHFIVEVAGAVFFFISAAVTISLLLFAWLLLKFVWSSVSG